MALSSWPRSGWVSIDTGSKLVATGSDAQTSAEFLEEWVGENVRVVRPAETLRPGQCRAFRIHARFTVEALKVISREASANVSQGGVHE